jgi:hypothetical protein
MANTTELVTSPEQLRLDFQVAAEAVCERSQTAQKMRRELRVLPKPSDTPLVAGFECWQGVMENTMRSAHETE